MPACARFACRAGGHRRRRGWRDPGGGRSGSHGCSAKRGRGFPRNVLPLCSALSLAWRRMSLGRSRRQPRALRGLAWPRLPAWLRCLCLPRKQMENQRFRKERGMLNFFEFCIHRSADWSRGDCGFGFPGLPEVRWPAVLTEEHPKMLHAMSLPGRLVVQLRRSHHCRRSWSPGQGAKRCYVRQLSVMITNQEGQTTMIRPLVTLTFTTPWGSDVLFPWGLCIEADF